jgi:ABC-type multidrug transport system fused ATPase/permease subunit
LLSDRPDRLDGVGSDSKSVLRLSAVTFAYPDGSVDPDADPTPAAARAAAPSSDDGVPLEGRLKVVLRSVDCKLAMRSKVAVLGGNGAGKVNKHKEVSGWGMETLVVGTMRRPKRNT